MEKLGQFYTGSNFSGLLVGNLAAENPKVVLELGSGNGSLLKAARQRWANAEFVCADIDPKSIDRINTELPFVRTFLANGLKINIDQEVGVSKHSIDVAICNPPFLQIREKDAYRSLFEESGLEGCLNLPRITSDMVFLAQNFRFLRPKGELGIILPDGLLTSKEFCNFRLALLGNHSVEAIIELPTKIFPKTEAKTHILILRKDGEVRDKVPLFVANRQGQCIDQIDVSATSLVDRMDYSHHKMKLTYRPLTESKSLGDFQYVATRGNKTKAYFVSQNLNFLHTTSFKHGEELELPNMNIQDSFRGAIAEKGDIVVSRVGRGCVGKSAIIRSGGLPITDCLYRIRASDEVLSKLWSFLVSNEGRKWLEANAHGVCARVLGKDDLRNIPIP